MKQILVLLCISLFLPGCSKKSTKVTYKLSEDLCLICDSAHYKVIGKDTVQLENIITPNDDAVNDRFYIKKYRTWENLDSINFTVFDREGKQVVHFEHYLNDWPKYLPSQNQQDVTGLSNGLYRYRLSSPYGNVDGLFIIIFTKDNYLDKNAIHAGCYNCLRGIDGEDPVFYGL